MSQKERQDEFAGFLANPDARQRGGAAVQALRCGGSTVQTTRNRHRWGLLKRLAHAEINRFWRVEIAVRIRWQTSFSPEHDAPALVDQERQKEPDAEHVMDIDNGALFMTGVCFR